MLRPPSHLARACGQSHYKKFWLMQTQTDSQDNCLVSSPSVLSFPATVLKGSDGKIIGNPACSPSSWNSTIETAPQGRASWPAVGSPDAGFGGISNIHRSNVSLSTCAVSLTLQRPDASSQLYLLPSEGCLAAGILDVDNESLDVAEPRVSSSLCASFSPCLSSSPAVIGSTDLGLQLSSSREPSPSDLAVRFVGTARDNAPTDPTSPGTALSDCEQFSVSVRDVSEDYTYSTGCGSFIRGDLLSVPSAQECKPANDSPSASSESKRPVESNFWSSLNVVESTGQFCRIGDDVTQESSKLASVEQHEECFADPSCLSAGRNVLRMCKVCGTTKTPLWRSGPQGPKSLCNACGIRFKKLKRSHPAGECTHVEVSSPSTPLSTKFSARRLKRKSASEKEIEVVKGRSHQRFKRSEWPTLVVGRRNCIPKVEDTESCLTSPGTPSPRKQLSHNSRASLQRKESVAKLALLENESVTSAFAADVKEAAILLMALSCGLVLA